MKTLYITDLDGTLLNSDVRVSPFTAQTINTLVEKGMLFSYATARSYATAGKITSGLSAHFPVALYNGALVMDSQGKEIILTNFIEQQLCNKILDLLTEAEVYPIVYHFTDKGESLTCMEEKANEEMADFINTKQGNLWRVNATDKKGLYCDNIYYFTCIDDAEKLFPLYEKLKKLPELNCLYLTDVYSGGQWLDIMSASASKASAIVQLKEKLGRDKVVCFGDEKNDISMFLAADECYAVANAVSELKEIATDIIASNNEDGVAKWLLENVEY